jgi:uncharacterized protein
MNTTDSLFFQFEWDVGNREKCQKHGVSIQEIEALFLNAPFVTPDVKHSHTEMRYIAAGKVAGRALFVAFTMREDDTGNECIRPISARYMHQREADYYDQQTDTTH